MEKEIVFEIKSPYILLLILITLIFFVLEVNVTIKTPISFGDEGWHTRMAQWIAEEVEYPTWIPFSSTKLIKRGFGRPPLWNILEGGFFFLFGVNELIPKLLVPFIALLTGLTTYLLVSKLYNKKIGFIASVLFISIPSFVTYSVLFYTDILFVFYTTIFFFTFLIADRDKNTKYYVLCGTFGALSFLTKTPGIVTYIFIGAVFIYKLIKGFHLSLKKYTILILILLLIPASFFLRNYYYYKTPFCYKIPLVPISRWSCDIDNFEEKYEFKGRTEKVGTELSVFEMGITSYLSFTYGNLWLVVFSFLAGLFLFWFQKNSIKIFVILYLFLFLLIFLVSTSRAEDTARYTLGCIPAIALISGIYWEKVCKFIKKFYKHFEIIVFIFIIWFSYQNLQGKLIIMEKVKKFSPSFFEACEWIKANTPKNASIATLWSSRAVYSCQRNSPGAPADLRLSRNVSYILSVAKSNGITHLFIQKFSIDFQNRQLSEKYDWDFVQFLENHPKHFKKVYENGPSLQQCLQQGVCDGNIVYEIIY